MAENEWTDELKAEVAAAYESADPTPETTMDIVKDLADKFDKTANGVRMVLTRAGVYVKKQAPTTSTASKEGGSKRVNKAEAIGSLKTKIKALNQDVDDDICDRLTGKAAVYIHSILEAIA
jgi:hypothetical protein